jgi:hypothetical protein
MLFRRCVRGVRSQLTLPSTGRLPSTVSAAARHVASTEIIAPGFCKTYLTILVLKRGVEFALGQASRAG